MGGKGGKRKGGGPAVLGFGAGGICTPSLTPSASGSVAGTQLAAGVSYDVPVKVSSMSVVESVGNVAALSEGVENMGWPLVVRRSCVSTRWFGT